MVFSETKTFYQVLITPYPIAITAIVYTMGMNNVKNTNNTFNYLLNRIAWSSLKSC